MILPFIPYEEEAECDTQEGVLQTLTPTDKQEWLGAVDQAERSGDCARRPHLHVAS